MSKLPSDAVTPMKEPTSNHKEQSRAALRNRGSVPMRGRFDERDANAAHRLRLLICDVQNEIQQFMGPQGGEPDFVSLCALIDRLALPIEGPRVRRVIRNYVLDAPSVRLLQKSEESTAQAQFITERTNYLKAVAQGKCKLSPADGQTEKGAADCESACETVRGSSP